MSEKDVCVIEIPIERVPTENTYHPETRKYWLLGLLLTRPASLV